jgi:hypothetical protein
MRQQAQVIVNHEWYLCLRPDCIEIGALSGYTFNLLVSIEYSNHLSALYFYVNDKADNRGERE